MHTSLWFVRAGPSPRNIRWTRMLHPSPRFAGRGDNVWHCNQSYPLAHEVGEGA